MKPHHSWFILLSDNIFFQSSMYSKISQEWLSVHTSLLKKGTCDHRYNSLTWFWCWGSQWDSKQWQLNPEKYNYRQDQISFRQNQKSFPITLLSPRLLFLNHPSTRIRTSESGNTVPKSEHTKASFWLHFNVLNRTKPRRKRRDDVQKRTCDWYSMAFDVSFPFICRENSRRSGIPLFPTILRTQRFRLSCSSRMVGDKSGKLGLILCNNFPEAPEISAMISDHSSNYYVGHRRHSLAGCRPSNKSISAHESKTISLSTYDVTNFWSPLWLKH